MAPEGRAKWPLLAISSGRCHDMELDSRTGHRRRKEVAARASFKPNHKYVFSVAFGSPAKSLTFSGLMENPLVGKNLKS